MNIQFILSDLDAEIARLQRAKEILTDTSSKRQPGRPPKTETPIAEPKKRNLSPEGRARIAAAVKARWAKQKKGK